MNVVGNKIREIREGKKISQFAVAYALGMSQAAYSKIERGETEVKVKHLYCIATILHVSIYNLLPASMENSVFDGNNYLLKPLIIKIQIMWFEWRNRKKNI